MPQYIYRCESGHEREFESRMFYSTAVLCECGEGMWRVPQAFMVNWNGPKPSDRQWHPNARRFFDTVDERRDEFVKEHEEHERRTEKEHEER